jgi:Glyoxalase-like domain
VRPVQIAFDAQDPARLAAFWAAVLADRGYREPDPPEGGDTSRAVEEPTGTHPRLYFQRVPEAKTAKNRVHLDLLAGGGHTVPLDEQRAAVAEAVRRLTALGASYVGERTELGVHWAVMTDPEGNEFCA